MLAVAHDRLQPNGPVSSILPPCVQIGFRLLGRTPALRYLVARLGQ